MSSDALNWAKQIKVGNGNRKAVLMILADYADEQGSCYPGQWRIAEEAEVGERTVRRILSEFEEMGVLYRKARIRKEGRGRTSDRYYLCLDWRHDQPAKMASKSDQPAKSDDQPATGARPTGQSLAGDPLGNHQEEPPDIAPVVAKATPARSNGRKRDRLFEALCESCGMDWHNLTASARGPTNRALKELRDVDATPDEVRCRARHYSMHMPNATLTPSALAKHWALCEHPPRPKPSPNEVWLASQLGQP